MPWHTGSPPITGKPGATWIAATGEQQPESAPYGIALLSRYPVTSWQVLRLPRTPTRFPMYLPVPGRVMIVNEEPRAAVLARVDTPLGDMTIAGDLNMVADPAVRWSGMRSRH